MRNAEAALNHRTGGGQQWAFLNVNCNWLELSCLLILALEGSAICIDFVSFPPE